MFEEKYYSEFPVGLYIDIPDEKGIYRKWLITEPANQLGLQFPTWYVLPCDHLFQWVYDNKKYQMYGVGRSQSSYNSGEWISYKITAVENQRKCILPMNEISTTIFYNQRIIISAPIKTPITWHCSKVEQTTPKGINRLTFVQEEWNTNTDVFEYEDGEISPFYNSRKRIIGMWADYFQSVIEPVPEPKQADLDMLRPIRAEIIHSGIKPQLKLGGSYKTFTVNYYNQENEKVYYEIGNWEYSIDGEDASEYLTILTSTDSSVLESNQIKIKIIENYDLLGKVLLITNKSGTVEGKLEIELLGM